MARRAIRAALLDSPPIDPQQQLVYLWENENFYAQFYGSKMSRAEAKKLAARMARYYKVAPPTMKYVRRGRRFFSAWQQGSTLTINLDKAHWTPAMLAHEVAHLIVEAYGRVASDHGPVFMGVYFNLMDHFRILPFHCSIPSARLWTVKVRDPADVAPGKLKEAKRR